MGIFSNLFKKTDKEEVAPVEPVMNDQLPTQLSLTKIDLRKNLVKVSLEKKNMQLIRARVCAVFDESGSTSWLYENGTVQDVIERVLPIGLKMDDDQSLDVWSFSNGFKRRTSITEKDFNNYVKKVMNRRENSGTEYSPVIDDIVKKYIKEDKNNKLPVFVLFITDGETQEERAVTKSLEKASHYNIFFQFIGIGDESFNYLKSLKNIGNRKVINTNFIKLVDINNVPDEQLYDLLLTHYPIWEKEAKLLRITE